MNEEVKKDLFGTEPAKPESVNFTPVKILLLGDPGSGKTGSLASLVKAGYNLRVMDFDNGTEILRNLLTKEEYATISIIPLQDRRKAVKVPVYGEGKNVIGYKVSAIPVRTDAWQKAVDLICTDWKDPATQKSFGSVYTWTSQDVLVFDSLTHAWRTALNFILAINNRLGYNPTQPEWGTCQGMILDVLSTFFDASIKCNVVCCAHIAYDTDQNEILHGLPAGPGRALNREIGTYFNHTIRAATIGNRHSIVTQSDGVVELKSAAPGKIKSTYPIESGLADYFAAVRSEVK
jgi:AAA domain